MFDWIFRERRALRRELAQLREVCARQHGLIAQCIADQQAAAALERRRVNIALASADIRGEYLRRAAVARLVEGVDWDRALAIALSDPLLRGALNLVDHVAAQPGAMTAEDALLALAPLLAPELSAEARAVNDVFRSEPAGSGEE